MIQEKKFELLVADNRWSEDLVIEIFHGRVQLAEINYEDKSTTPKITLFSLNQSDWSFSFEEFEEIIQEASALIKEVYLI